MADILKKPLGKSQIMARMDRDGYIKGVVAVDLEDVIDGDREAFLNVISTKLVGSDLLMDISYRLVGQRDDVLYIEVIGDPSEALQFAEGTGSKEWRPGISPEED